MTAHRRYIWRTRAWIALFRVRRQLRRLEKEHAALSLKARIDLEEQRERYEEALAIERSRLTRVQQDWANNYFRILRLEPAPTLLPVDLKDEVPDPKHRTPPPEDDAADSLNYDAHQVYLEKKTAFWEEGEEMGFDESQIRQEWAQIRDRVIEDARDSIIGA